jgi:hypothetical protein
MHDIREGGDKDWLVVAWFTDDYRTLAEQLAFQLKAVGAPYHLFRRDKPAHGWDPRQKPSVVMHAMQTHPGKTLILMDVDCIVRGDIEPVTRFEGDVGISLKARQKYRKRGGQQPLVVTISSRVVVFKPTPGAWTFVTEWERLCKQTEAIDDETAMAWAYLKKPGVAYAQLDQRYAGQEINVPSLTKDVVILHDSAHDPQGSLTIRNMLKAFERRFLRTGRSKARIQRMG